MKNKLKKIMSEEQKATARVYICLGGILLFFTILCFGCRQLALLEERIQTQVQYEILENELIELTDDGIEELFTD